MNMGCLSILRLLWFLRHATKSHLSLLHRFAEFPGVRKERQVTEAKSTHLLHRQNTDCGMPKGGWKVFARRQNFLWSQPIVSF